MSAGSISKTLLVGNMGQDPEVRPLPSGGIVANISVATTETWKDNQTNQTVEDTEWHRVAVFGKSAEYVRDYLRKGDKVHVSGRNKTRKWQDQNGQDRYSTEVVVKGISGEISLIHRAPQNRTDTQQPQGNQQPQGAQQPQGGYPPSQQPAHHYGHNQAPPPAQGAYQQSPQRQHQGGYPQPPQNGYQYGHDDAI